MIGKLFVVFLITLLAFQCHLLKKARSISGLCLARDCTFFDTIRFNLIVYSSTQSIRFLTFFDTIRFCRSLALLNERTKSKSKIKNERQLFSLRRDRFGNALSDTTKHFLNLMSYLTLKVSCCRMVSTLSCHPGICAKKNSSSNLNPCGNSFYISVPVL